MVDPDGERTVCDDMEEDGGCPDRPASAVGTRRFAFTGSFCSPTPPLVCAVGNGSAVVFEGAAGAGAIPADGAFDALEDRGVEVTVGVGIGNAFVSSATAAVACTLPLLLSSDSRIIFESFDFITFPDCSVSGAVFPAAKVLSAPPLHAIDGINNMIVMMNKFLFIYATDKQVLSFRRMPFNHLIM